jgi:hybrid polyketide synthase / nonribosomal peptide synthetase ACE1
VHSNSIALKDDKGLISLTYRDLASRAEQIWDKLLAEGIKAGDKVAIFQEPTPDWICSMLADFWIELFMCP